jgi:PilZ domain-containing protein
MALGMGHPKSRNFSGLRRDARVPMEVEVQISGHAQIPGTEFTFTENVSARGARVLSSRRWKPNEQLVLTTNVGSFRSVARVAYCQPVQQACFAIGLEFVEPSGTWVVNPGGAS